MAHLAIYFLPITNAPKERILKNFYKPGRIRYHWGRVTHICVRKLTIIGSDNDLSPGRRQAITRTNDGILLIRPLGTNFSEILSEIHTFSFKKMHLKTSSAKWRPFCLGLNMLNVDINVVHCDYIISQNADMQIALCDFIQCLSK